MAKVLDVLTNKEKVDEVEEIEVPDNELPEVVQDIVDERKTIGETVSHEVLEQIYSKDNLSMKTDLNSRSAIVFAGAESLANIFKCDVLKDFANSAKEHLISKGRKGRGEMVDVIKNSQDTFTDEEPPSGLTKFFK